MTPLLLLAALGCTDDTTGTTAPVDTSDSAPSGLDSADPTDSGAADTDSQTTPDSGQGVEIDLGVLSVSPRELRVDPGATWDLRAVHTLAGDTVDVTPAWESSDTGVVTVAADGVATAIAPGQASISGYHDGLVVHAAVTVQAVPELRVQLVAAETGLPLSAATVHCGEGSGAVDPVTGGVSLPVPAGEPVTCTGLADDDSRIPATVMDVVGRQLVVPLRLRGQLDPDSEIQGTFDFSNLPPLSDDEKSAGWVVLGIAGGSLRLGPLFWRADEVLSPNRDVEIFGLEVRVPGNLAIDEYFEEWLTPAWSGDAGVWSMAGPVPLADAILGLSNLDEALDFLLSNMDGFVYSHDPGLTVPAETPLELQVAPATSLSEAVQVTLPEWPEGFALDNPATLVALDGSGPEGPAVVGFGRGFAGEHHVSRVPGSFFGWDGSDSQVLAYLEVGGLGTLGAKSLRSADVVDGVAEIGPMQTPPAIPAWDEDNLSLELTVDPRADLVFLYLSNINQEERDYYLPPPNGPVDISLVGPEMGMYTLTFEAAAVETDQGTFEGLVAEGAYMRPDLAPIAVTTGFVTEKFTVESIYD